MKALRQRTPLGFLGPRHSQQASAETLPLDTDPWEAFQRDELRPAWLHFESRHEVPEMLIESGRYRMKL